MRSIFKFLGLLLLYVLSTGPAAWLGTKLPAVEPVLRTIYSPITLLCRLCHPAAYALLWYLDVIWRIPIDL